ncbi:MAG TPA: glutamate 5-kinase [Candidatus Hydrogenedentes bacterium]|nr:glutamate 5-kinase [Candidatus Hydrogenedentota bacterium]HIJ73244.1 glutamate 5-kinase [Candidatus Hydrogenedentota bacterium]
MSTKPIDVRTLVVKIGTALLTGPQGFDRAVLENIVKEMAQLKRERNLNIVVVSSGAVGCGMAALGISEYPRLLPVKQAVAAVGQSRLMHHYEVLFQTHGNGLKTAQVLLTAAALEDRRTYLNVRNTILALFQLGDVIPIVNENDSVATEELRFGDNDGLAARVASKIDADLLIILSDVDGLYDRNPARDKNARLIPFVENITEDIEALAEDTITETTIGGMKTKLAAAQIACAAGLRTIVANGHRPNAVANALDGAGPMTVFDSGQSALPHRKRWIAFGRASRGALVVDDGAARALLEHGKSLLAAGITALEGTFDVGAAVKIRDASGRDIARGLVNYSSKNISRIKGRKSAEIKEILGRKDFDEVIHRDNLVLL